MFLILAVITARFFIFTENPGWFEWADFLIMAAAMVLLAAMVIRRDVKALFFVSLIASLLAIFMFLYGLLLLSTVDGKTGPGQSGPDQNGEPGPEYNGTLITRSDGETGCETGGDRTE